MLLRLGRLPLPGSRSAQLQSAQQLSVHLPSVDWQSVAPVSAGWKSTSCPFGGFSYAELRFRWEYGHGAPFALWLAGYCCLQWFAMGRCKPLLHLK